MFAVTTIGRVLEDVARGHRGMISRTSNIICRINLEEVYDRVGLDKDQLQENNFVFIPIIKVQGISQININGPDFKGFSQLESDIIVPEWMARESTLQYQRYIPPKKLIYCS
ncbi:hypothetical protein GOV12_04625 [Candidatus Pacearchaeota archaeon]|nr:hypothetical protein [Candidatus Pacearchaeota archaeon]